MTDGIIQKIFKNHKEIREKEFVPTTHYGLDTLFEQLQQELIEKIKEMYKECENIKQYNCEDGAFVEGIFYTYDKLLGDNQE